MTVWVFRQEREDNSSRLLQEIRRGWLRQGWSYHESLDIRKKKTAWIAAYRRRPSDGSPDPKLTYEKLVGMVHIEPGDLLVVPNQPDDESFALVRSVAAPGARASDEGFPAACYRFLRPVGGDFRSGISVDPATLCLFRFGEPRFEPLRRFGSHRRPVQRLKLNSAVGVLLEAFENSPQPSAELPKSRRKDSMLAGFHPPADSDYQVTVRGGHRKQTRRHQTLVRQAGEYLGRRGVEVHTPHPKDLEIRLPGRAVIVEAKLSHGGAPAPIREAIGQLFWYRYHHGPRDADLAILLDKLPEDDLIAFLESGVGVFLMWWTGRGLAGGPKTVAALPKIPFCN